MTLNPSAKSPVHIPLEELEPKDAAAYAAKMFAEVRNLTLNLISVLIGQPTSKDRQPSAEDSRMSIASIRASRRSFLSYIQRPTASSRTG